MTSSEIAFLALGLVLGGILGAALVQVVRARPAPRREVRLTITPNAIPARHSQTLSSGYLPSSTPQASGPPAPAARPAATATSPGGARADGPGNATTRTRVPSAGVVLPSTAVAVPVGEPSATPATSAPGDARPAVDPPRPPVPPRLPQNPQPRANDGPGAPVMLAAGIVTAVAVMDAPDRPRSGNGAAPAPLPGPGTRVRPSEWPAIVPETRPLPETGPSGATSPEGFTTLVRPRLPVEAVRPILAAGVIPAADRPAGAPPRVALIGGLAPVIRPVLAPPSGPTLTRPRAAAETPRTPDLGAGPDSADASGAGGPAGAGGAASAAGAAADPATDPCAGPRRAIDERCALAGVAREKARRAADALREAQRVYDVLRDRVDRAEAQADPREVAAAKERLHADFRAAGERAGGAEETEAAARAWLSEINALNTAVREAQRTVETGTAELRTRIGALERLSAEADAARIAGENAEAGCREAREELAGCEEAAARTRRPATPEPAEPHPFERVWPEESPDLPQRPAPADLLAGLPLIVRVLRGDREARERLVAALATDDIGATRDWGLRVSRLADAIIGRAIEDGYLDLPGDHPFWRLFSHRESRDIVGALSALGFRFDGMGGFADGRAPAARDLSLAVGYAGLDRMRIRSWPRDSEITIMYAGAVVAADEWLADQAGDLSLGRMVDALGNRAADLADVWNAWGRVRPALLST